MNTYFTKIKTGILLTGLLFFAFSPVSAEDNQSAETEKSSLEGDFRFVEVSRDKLLLLPLPDEMQELTRQALPTDYYHWLKKEIDSLVWHGIVDLSFANDHLGKEVYFHSYGQASVFFRSKIDSIGLFWTSDNDPSLYLAGVAQVPSVIQKKVKWLSNVIQWMPSLPQKEISVNEIRSLKRTEPPLINDEVRSKIIDCVSVDSSLQRFIPDSLVVTEALPGDEKGNIDYYSVRYHTIFDSVMTIRNFLIRKSGDEFQIVFSNKIDEQIRAEYGGDSGDGPPDVRLSLEGVIDYNFDGTYEIVIIESHSAYYTSWEWTLLRYKNGKMESLASYYDGGGC